MTDQKPTLTILTPTYNRAYILHKAYESLLRQTDKDFEWVIVDDGSTDNTRALVESWIAEQRVQIIYRYKENGGKHTAHNTGVQMANGEITYILDSDDYIVDDAVETINSEWQIVRENHRIGSIDFLRGNPSSGCVIGDCFPADRMLANWIDLSVVRKIHGDKCGALRTSIYLAHLFPVYNDEKFVTEATVWYEIAKRYNMFCINKILQWTVYRQDGLTAARKTEKFTDNIRGWIDYYNVCTTKEFPWETRYSSMKNYIARSLFVRGLFATIRMSKSPMLCLMLMPFGIRKLFSLILKRNGRRCEEK